MRLIEAEIVDHYGSLTAEDLEYFPMSEAGSSNTPHDNNNDENDDEQSKDGEEK
jgi:hypothetical protein